MGQQVVADAEPRHGRQVAARRPRRATSRPISARSPSPDLERVERLAAQRLARRVLLVPAADLGVEVPAVEVERLGDRRDLGDRQVLAGRRSRRRRRRPARRCRRCSSAPRPARPRARRQRTRTSPSTALRRWPMCAALFGLMLVCSTITLPAPSGPAGAGERAARRAGGRRSAGAVEEDVQVAGALDPELAHQPGSVQALAQLLGDLPRLALQRRGRGGGRPGRRGRPARGAAGSRRPARARRRSGRGSRRARRARRAPVCSRASMGGGVYPRSVRRGSGAIGRC